MPYNKKSAAAKLRKAKAMASCPGGNWSKSSKLFCVNIYKYVHVNMHMHFHVAQSALHIKGWLLSCNVINGHNGMFIFSPSIEAPIGSGRRPPVIPWPKSRHSGKQHKVHIPQESTNKEVNLSVINICMYLHS